MNRKYGYLKGTFVCTETIQCVDCLIASGGGALPLRITEKGDR